MPYPRLALTATLIALAISGAQPLQAQTPEQRYSDWVRRLDFRPQEYAFRRSYMLRLLQESGGGLLLVPSSDGRTDGATFRQLEDFWYYTGLEVPNSMLVLDGDANRATLYLPTSDDRFEDSGRPNDFPGRPLLDDYRLRSIAGVEEYRDIADLAPLINARAQAGRAVRVNGGTLGPIPEPSGALVGSLDPTNPSGVGGDGTMSGTTGPHRELVAATEDGDGILCVRSPETHRGWNGIRYKTGMSASNVGSLKLSMNVATVPPAAVAFAHTHVDFEVMLYILQGRVRHEYGEGLGKSMDNEAGDFIFIEPGVPHEVLNLSETEPVIAVVARSDASEWENIVDYPSARRPAAGGA